MDRVREQVRSLGREHEPPDGVAAFRARPVTVRVPFPAEPVPVVLVRETRIVVVPPAREHHALVRREPALRFRDAKLMRPAVGALGRVRRVRHLAAEFQHAEAIRELRLEPAFNSLLARNLVHVHVHFVSFVLLVSNLVSREFHVREPPSLRKRPSPRHVPPLPGLRVHPVHRQKSPRVIRHRVQRIRRVLNLIDTRKVRQGHAREPGS